MNTILTILVSLLIFGILILSHEFGHFIVARKCGVTVEEFAIGMGPVIWKKETDETTYSIRLFPIGGFCQMKGEDSDEDEAGSFSAISPLKKILVLSAGSAMNFLFAVILFFIIICISGNVATTTVATVLPDSPATASGLMPGDEILAVDGVSLGEWDELSVLINQKNGDDVVFTVISGSESVRKDIILTPYLDEETQIYKVGITPEVTTNVFSAFFQSFGYVFTYIRLIFEIFGQLFGGVIGMEAFSGPIGATVIIGQTMSMGVVYVLNIAASIAVSLGLFNMFPFPALDGSRVLFALIEWIKGSPVNPKWESSLHLAGLVFLLGFAVFIAYNDIITFF